MVEIYIAVCKYMYETCDHDIYNWSNLYDLRGNEYRLNYLNAVAGTVQEVAETVRKATKPDL
jgi:hypothetical protein